MKPNYRRCISCRKVAHKREFWRIVRVHPTQTIALDQGSGRSAYLCPCSDCLRLAQKKNRLARALKAPVPDSLHTTLWQRLAPPESFESVKATSATERSDPAD